MKRREFCKTALLTGAATARPMARAQAPDAADNERNRAQVHAAWDKLKQFTSGFYVNLNDPDQKAVDDNYGPNHPRLAALKKPYDPSNLFRLNANVRPVT